MKIKFFSILLFSILLLNCDSPIQDYESFIAQSVNPIDNTRITQADSDDSNWLTYGKNFSETRFSTLDQISKDNINDLGLAWSLNLGTKRGIEATPIVVDGIMFISGPWSIVYAIDARNGKLIWTFDPKVPKETGERACCDVVNRGVAIYKGNVYVGTLDGRLISIKASNGSVNWEVNTIKEFESDWSYTITGAPRVFDGKVLIGNGGAEYGVRGFFSAYDALTGEKIWRFFTVPGNPDYPSESEAMENALKTWNGEWWKYGGGGTAWDSFAYDPELELVYIGTGNGSPWNQEIRSPGGGDNLYLSSILAVDVKTGTLKWHYQTTPGETWDYTAVQQIILSDLEIDNKTEKVLMQAPKNGFFYVLNRETGKLLSADPFVYVNWAEKIDLETGRPIEAKGARHKEKNMEIYPGPWGGHNWQAMAFNPQEKLVFIPARELSMVYGKDDFFNLKQFNTNSSSENKKITYSFDKKQWNTGTSGLPGSDLNDRETIMDSTVELKNGKLIAWDPLKKKEIWAYNHKTAWNSGVLSTKDMVFQGDAFGILRAHDVTNGNVIWEFDIKSGIIAPPITYKVDGIQYITISSGWGGSYGLYNRHTKSLKPGTIYTFALNHSSELPNYPEQEDLRLVELENQLSEEEIIAGRNLFNRYCQQCHSLRDYGNGSLPGGGNIPDLTYSKKVIFDMFDQIVLEGVFLEKGMPNFGSRLNKKESFQIKEYIISMANMP
jgi:quinohemoprotein ethanol dehydrogenase